MNSKIYFAVTSAILLSGCASQEQKSPSMANPASEYCIKIGGKSIIQKDSNGSERGFCKLPDGKLVDEWELFRKSQK